jgi:peptidoglycan/xylan/chitin deacetylase (PgdA/CDA1 family)
VISPLGLRVPKLVLSALSPGGQRGRLSILIFHRVLPTPDPLFPDEVDAARFDELLTWLRHWMNVLPLDEAVRRLKAGSLPPRAAAITFDDGYADNRTIAMPLLQKHKLSAAFFISTGFLDGGRMWNDTIIESVRGTKLDSLACKTAGISPLALGTTEQKRSALTTLINGIKHLPSTQRAEAVAEVAESSAAMLPNDLMMSSAQVRELRDGGMVVGAHTVSHPILARLEFVRAQEEVATSKHVLEALLGEKLGLFAYPNGKLDADYCGEHVGLVKSLGFEAAVSTNWGAAGAGCDLFQLPRFTPWDKDAGRFGLRLASNLRRRYPGA